MRHPSGRTIYRAWPAAIAVLGAVALPAHAQDQTAPTDPEDEAATLAEVVVTATRVATPLDRLPARVEIITREDFETRNYVTVVDALQATPGITIVQSGGAGTLTSVFSRGTNSKHTLALFDGIRLNDASAPNGQYNFGQDTTGGLERIEVVRGPASAIYGSDAIGGVINFIPRVGGKTPFEPFFEAAVGSRETYRGMIGAGGTTGPLAYTASFEHFETEGFNNTPDRFPDTLGESDGSTFSTFTGVADVRLSDTLVIRGLGRWRKTETEFDDVALDRIGQKVEDEYRLWRVGPSLTLFGDRLSVEIEGGQVRNERLSTNDPDANAPTPGPDSGAIGTRNFANWRNRLTVGDWGALEALSVSVGAEWQDEEIEVTGGFSDPLTRAESAVGVYGLAQFRVGGRIDVSASARFDSPEAFDEVGTWNLGASLDMPELSSRFYTSAGSSFKAPTLSERFSRSAFNVGNPNLMPEEGQSWEVGFDTEFGAPFGPGMGLGGTYFGIEIDDLIEYNFAERRNVNVGVAEIEGYEAYVELRASAQYKARVAYTYTDAVNGLTDVRLLRRPPHQWIASIEARPVSGLTLTADVLYRGDRLDIIYADTNPFGRGGGFAGTGVTEPYTVVNAAITSRLTDAVTLFGGVRNLFEEDYEEPNGFQAEPRTWSVGLRGKF